MFGIVQVNIDFIIIKDIANTIVNSLVIISIIIIIVQAPLPLGMRCKFPQRSEGGLTIYHGLHIEDLLHRSSGVARHLN
jgi:hypothetical protein